VRSDVSGAVLNRETHARSTTHALMDSDRVLGHHNNICDNKGNNPAGKAVFSVLHEPEHEPQLPIR
jgi:hypothetical protein